MDVDPGQISQVANNIFINATQAMPGGGTITIRGENVKVEAHGRLHLAPGHYVRTTISDTGCGISAEHLRRIFDPYFTTKSGGSGLGLASAHSIISKHGGYIGVSSEVGKGTTFEILLPTSDRPAPAEPLGTSPLAIAGRPDLSVLVMDDEDFIREMLAAMLSRLGYKVQTCAHGEEAVKLYETAMALGSPYCAVIMDLTIPGGMGGQEAAKQILAKDPEACLIVSSGYSNDPVMADHVAFGFKATLGKPYSLAAVTRTLSNLLPQS